MGLIFKQNNMLVSSPGNVPAPAQPARKPTAEKVRPIATLPCTQGKQGTALDPDGDTVINAIPFQYEEGLDTVEPEIKAKPFGIGGDDSIAAEDTTAQEMGDPNKGRLKVVSEQWIVQHQGQAKEAVAKGIQALALARHAQHALVDGHAATAIEAFTDSIRIDARKTRPLRGG